MASEEIPLDVRTWAYYPSVLWFCNEEALTFLDLCTSQKNIGSHFIGSLRSSLRFACDIGAKGVT
jgi:hypothetical protein